MYSITVSHGLVHGLNSCDCSQALLHLRELFHYLSEYNETITSRHTVHEVHRMSSFFVDKAQGCARTEDLNTADKACQKKIIISICPVPPNPQKQ
jgi:hypothetical protein